MRPLTVINGILFGITSALALGLAVVVFLFLILMRDHPELERELPSLLTGAAVFLLAAPVTGAAFYGNLRERAWRWYAQIGVLLAIGAAAAYFLSL